MDATTERLVDFALQTKYESLSAASVHECKRRLIDTFGCAIGAYGEPLSGMARALASRSQGNPGATVWGSSIKTTPELAAFTNGTMLRFLDISDTYIGKSRGHPSDMIAGILAVAEVVHADGRSVISAISTAYDVYCSVGDSVDWTSKGWDQPVYCELGAVLGIGKLLQLSREQMGQAVSLALTPNMALAQTRRGELSSWKGCAGPNAARNAVFAAMLAREGFTGPEEIFEGSGGVWDVAGRFDWSPPSGSLMATTHLKSLPVCYHGQSAVLAALELRGRVDPQDISEISVDAYRTAVLMMGDDASRWAPSTRETADHSLPYVISIALLDGAVTCDSFGEQRFTDPAVVALMNKVKVSEDAQLSKQYPESNPTRVVIRTSSGDLHEAYVQYPKGHAKSPMSDGEVEGKFCEMLRHHPLAGNAHSILQKLWKFDQVGDAAEMIGLFAAAAEADSTNTDNASGLRAISAAVRVA